MEAVLEKLVVEQLLYTIPTDLRIWIAERKPADRAEAGRLADDYTQARRHIRQVNRMTRTRTIAGRWMLIGAINVVRRGTGDGIAQSRRSQGLMEVDTRTPDR